MDEPFTLPTASSPGLRTSLTPLTHLPTYPPNHNAGATAQGWCVACKNTDSDVCLALAYTKERAARQSEHIVDSAALLIVVFVVLPLVTLFGAAIGALSMLSIVRKRRLGQCGGGASRRGAGGRTEFELMAGSTRNVRRSRGGLDSDELMESDLEPEEMTTEKEWRTSEDMELQRAAVAVSAAATTSATATARANVESEEEEARREKLISRITELKLKVRSLRRQAEMGEHSYEASDLANKAHVEMQRCVRQLDMKREGGFRE